MHQIRIEDIKLLVRSGDVAEFHIKSFTCYKTDFQFLDIQKNLVTLRSQKDICHVKIVSTLQQYALRMKSNNVELCVCKSGCVQLSLPLGFSRWSELSTGTAYSFPLTFNCSTQPILKVGMARQQLFINITIYTCSMSIRIC